VLHQAADVVHVARQPVELRHDDGDLGLASALDRVAQLRPVIVGAALGLGVGLDQLERLSKSWRNGVGADMTSLLGPPC